MADTLIVKSGHNMPLDGWKNHKDIQSNAYQCTNYNVSQNSKISMNCSSDTFSLLVYWSLEVWSTILLLHRWIQIQKHTQLALGAKPCRLGVQAYPGRLRSPLKQCKAVLICTSIFRVSYLHNGKGGFTASKCAPYHLSISQMMPPSSECSSEQEYECM